MAQSKVTINLGKLKKIQEDLGANYYAKVGILQDSRYPDGTSMVLVGTVQEFGSVTNNIPPRSFLRMPLMTRRKELLNVIGKKSVQKFLDGGDIVSLFKTLGLAGQKIVDDAFATGGFGQWKKLENRTVKRKGSSAILIDTGALRRSVSSAVGKDNARES